MRCCVLPALSRLLCNLLPAGPSRRQQQLLHVMHMPAVPSILQEAVASGSARLLSSLTDPSATGRAPDAWVSQQAAASLVVVPLQPQGPTARYRAGLYITHAQPTNFDTIKRAVITIASLVQPLVAHVLLQDDVMAALQSESAAMVRTQAAAAASTPMIARVYARQQTNTLPHAAGL